MSSLSSSDISVSIFAGTHDSSPIRLISINAATLILFKLSKGSNYVFWRAQFSNLLFEYDLLGYIDSSFNCPPAMLNISEEPSPISNPAHKLWLRQDRLILQAIQASVIRSVALLISACVTAANAWSKL